MNALRPSPDSVTGVNPVTSSDLSISAAYAARSQAGRSIASLTKGRLLRAAFLGLDAI
jgi:hypothetical protein